MNWYPRQISVCLTLLIFVALTSGYATYNGDVALEYSGLVKIHYNGKWGTICYSSSRARLMASAICRSLGLKYNYYSKSSSKIPAFMNGQTCKGDENSIMGCSYPYLSSYQYCSSKLVVKCMENPAELYCSFESNNCSMAINGTGYVWKRSLPPSSKDAGPITDHTAKTRYGKYMFASAVGFPGQKTDFKTKIFYPVAKSISFYYYMFGKDMGKLNIYRENFSGKTLLKTISGNHGDKWKYACVPLTYKYGKLQFVFEAVQGSGYMSDIAIDDVTISTNNCSFWNASCDFHEDTCNYDIDSKYSSYGWSLDKLFGLSDHFGSGYYLVFKWSYYSIMKTSVTSPLLDLPSEKIKVTFYYYMKSSSRVELQLRFVEDGDQMYDKSYFWQDSGDHGTLWQYGCMELPTNIKGRIMFYGITARGWPGGLALDDIHFSKGSCQIGITHNVCHFNNPKLCNYTIDCMNPNEYTWRRNQGSTSSSYTGPSSDYSKDTYGFYLYAEASYGSPNDTTLLNFEVSNVKDKFLVFAYNMFGNTVGNLVVRFIYKNSMYEDVWKKEGNQGLYWHKECIFISGDISIISFIGTRGSSYSGDMAVDRISIESKGCGGSFDCDFQEQLCKYKIYSYGLEWNIEKEYTNSSDTNGFLKIYSRTSSESYTFQLSSPYASVINGTSVSFKYKLTDKVKVFALLARYSSSNRSTKSNASSSSSSYSTKKLWSSYGEEHTEFKTACVDLPSSDSLSLQFEVTPNPNSYYYTLVSLDDIAVNNETCKFGITHHFCEFKEPHLCDYTVECPENSEYTWQLRSYSPYRSGSIPYTNSGYMYTDSSKGKPGDKSELVFKKVQPPTGKSLYFTYFITENNGNLKLQIEDSYKNITVFEESGDSKGVYWNDACVNVPSDNRNYTYRFIATRTFGFTGQIALLNVGFREGDCQDRSISCDFSNPMICQYQNFTYQNWERVPSGNESGSINDVYMQSHSLYGTAGLASPRENINNSCVQIRYKILGRCNLTIYNALNKESLLSVVSHGTTPWHIYQVYIDKATPTKLIFLKDYVYTMFYGFSPCSVLLDHISITKNKCPDLVCPPGTIKCKNEYCFNASKVCDKVSDCSDDSDEKDCTKNSISCNFNSNYICGYRLGHRFFHVPNDVSKAPFFPGTMQTMSGKGEIFSPAEILNKSCVKVGYITQGAVIGNISIISNKLDSDGKVTRSVEWSETFFNEKDGIYEGQFQYNGGNTFLKIETNIESGSLSFDYITVSKGDCSALNCPGNTFMCTDKTKCIQQKDRCNNHWNCKDGSDENACLNTFNCTFEDKNMCGFKSSPEYCLELDFGVRSKNPSRDHSKGTVYGQYIRLNCNNESRIILPKITMGTTFCLDFYYIFSGYGNLSVYNNNTLLMKLPKFDAEIWMNVNLTLSKGVHNISLVYSGGNLTTLAFDSVVTKQGKCPAKGCPENWYPCNDNNTCYPYTQKCDGIINCPNGEDEKGCASNKTTYKLTGGRDLWSGKLKMLSGSEYLPVCAYSISNFTLDTVCSQLGLNGTSYLKRKTEYITGKYVECYNYGYHYSRCYTTYCGRSCHCNVPYVFCSNTTCPHGKVSCFSSRNQTNYTNTCIFKDSVCDGYPDCDDHSDEEDCESCTDDQWQCRNKKCIKKDLRCNAKNDCSDSSDESHCFKYKENNKTVQMFYEGSYKPICESNLKTTDVANKLCSYVGRRNGTFNGSISGEGIVFRSKFSDDDQLIPGFEPESISQCNIAKLDCSEQQCGTRMISSNESSVMSNGGQLALDGEWPWSVAVHIPYYYLCIGVIIDKYHVLISASCLSYRQPENLHIKTGSTRQSSGDEYDVDKILKSNEYGLTILRVKNEIKMSRSVQPACLPEHRMPRYTKCFAVGFGDVSTRLEELKVEKTEPTFCKKHNPRSGNNTFCFNDKHDEPPHCTFLGGSYVTCPNEHGKWTVYGIGQHTSCYANDLHPSVAFEVYDMKDWIEEEI